MLLLLVAIGGVGVHHAFSQVQKQPIQLNTIQTLNVYPASVTSVSWSSVEQVLTPDLPENAVYQKFSARNSAYVPVGIKHDEVVPLKIENTIPVHAEAAATTSATTSLEVAPPLQNEDVSVPITPVEDVAPTDAVPQPVTLKKATPFVFTFFESITQYLPFGNTAAVSDALPAQDEPTIATTTPLAPSVFFDESIPHIDNLDGSVTPATPKTPVKIVTPGELTPSTQTLQKNVVTKTLSLSDFSIPDLKQGEFMKGMQLRLSLGAQHVVDTSKPKPVLEIIYKTPSSTQEVGTIELTEEVSNAINGGYFLFALPEVIDTKKLNDITIEVSYKGDEEDSKNLYLDAVWLEVNIEKIDKTQLEAKVVQDTSERLEDPKLSTLLSSDVDFATNELPHFSLRYNSQRNAAIAFLRDLFGRPLATVEKVAFVQNNVGDVGVTPLIKMTNDGLLSIQLEEKDKERLQPGEYTVELSINEGGKVFTDSFSFQWGLLAINANKTSYEVGQATQISMGSLSPNGNTVCDAHLQLYIINPQDAVSKVAVAPSGLCNGNNVVDVPDYSATFVPETVGEYEMYLERLADDGTVISHTSDTFKVAVVLPLSLERNGPSRIYPKETYPMQITVHTKDTWKGKLVEVVPADFVISSTSAAIVRVGDTQELSWNVDVDKNSTEIFTYTFDAPDISPYLYTVGKARLEGIVPELSIVQSTSTDKVVPDVKIASSTIPRDDILQEQVPVVDTVTEPTGPTLFEKVLDLLHIETIQNPQTPVVPAEEDATPVELTEPTAMDQVVAEQIEARMAGDASTQKVGIAFEEHRQWQIASDATGSMIVYWTSGASVPAGWTCLSCGSGTFYQRFAKGGATYNSTGGAATHTHNASGTVGAASAAVNGESSSGSAISLPSHSHTITPAVTATSSLPAYRQLRVIQNNSAGEPATVPAGVVLMFDSTVPAGWTRYAQLDARYPRGENTISNGGSNTHRHTVSGTTAAASGSTVNGRTSGGTQVNAAIDTHTHTISTSTPLVNNEPPFVSVIYGTSTVATSTPTGAITMWTDTPPAQWQNQSATTTDPFFDKFTKGSATYGTTGGSDTHTHANITGIISSAATVRSVRTGAVGSNSTHTHSVDVTSFTAGSNIPPFVTAIFGRKYGAVPLYTQTKYRWFVNTDVSTPTDAWPVGAAALLENEDIDSSNVPLKNGDVVRLRMQLGVSNSTSTADTFKLQFASTTATCALAVSWTDVGNATSSAVWRGYNNASVADGATIASSTLSGTDKFETYEEVNPTASTPNTISTSQEGEWDFVMQQNNAYPGATYCFRMVKSAGTVLYAYTAYPTLVTNLAPSAPTLTKLFNNEKTPTTTPDFEFSGSDTEENDLTYQIQVDDDYAFTSTNIDKNSVTNSTQFSNLATPADKDPFTQGERIFFNNSTALTNGTTYYWRVRAKDPTGSNAYGSWSTIYSFTVDTSITLSTWFQTRTEQFDFSNTLDGVQGSSNQAQLRVGSTTGIMYSDPITFSEGQVGTAWGSFAFSDTEVTSNLKYTIQYNNNDVWTDIPDAALAGNGAGFGTSPVSLLGVDKTLYTELRIKATFTNSGATPSLQDWSVTWAYLIETPTITAPFANEKVSTTTPTFKFTTTDPQSDSLQYQIQWSTTYAFTASTTRNSNVNVGFTNLSHATDTDPFNSGDSIQFKLQAVDALTNGTTYWWRVKARDPGGSNTYSFFTDSRSFTVDTAVTVSTWFQTTQSQFSTDVLSNGYSRSTGVVTVATTTQNSLIAYAEGTITTPRYRTWNGTTWTAESSALDVGATINWVVTKASPIESEYVLATMGTDADVNVQVFSNGSWGHLQEITTTAANTAMRGFDVAYETVSGDAMVVTCDGDANPTYYIWNGSTWTNGGAVGLTTGNTCGWIKLIADPTSDEIIAVTRDTSGLGYEARVWTGSAWGNSTSWGSMNQANHEGIAAEYEESGGQAVVAVSNGTASSFTWLAWNGTAWSTPAVVQTNGDDFEAGNMVRDKGTDNMALCYIDEDGDIGVQRWTGAAWAAFAVATELDTGWSTASNLYNDRPVDCEFEVGGARDGFITAVYSDNTNLRYRTWTGAAWVAEASVSTIGAGSRVQLARTGDNLLQAIEFSTSTDSYRYSYWNGTTWSAQQTLETDASVGATPFKEPFMIAPENPSILGTVTGDPLISFYEGSGPYWKQMSWTDTTTGGSDILYQVEYYDGTNWALVPNSLLPGNSVGTTTSPINLANILPVSTYSKIRPVANMSCNLGTCPSLSDWTVTWSAGITITGTAQQYNQSTNVTSGTVAVAVNGVVQVGKTGTIAAGVWSIVNVNAAAGDVLTFFLTGATDATEAVAVTKYDGVGNMSGVNLYERHISIGSDDLSTVTNANLALYDFTNTEDIFYDVDGGNDFNSCATTGCNDAELIIKAGNTYQSGAGGDVATRYFENNGTVKLNGNTMRITRSWDNNATTSLATSTVIFTATSTTESIDGTGAVSPSFNNLTLGSSTSTATWNTISTLDVNGNLLVSGGTLARGSTAMTLAGNLTNALNATWTGIGTTTFDGTAVATWSDASAAVQNIGRVVVDGTNKSVILGSNVKARSVKIGADDTLDASVSGYTITVFTNWNNTNVFTARTGSVLFAATTTGRTITTGSSNFYNLSFTGSGGGWSFTGSTLGVDNDFGITAGTVTMPTATTTIAGSFTNAGTFVHNNGQLNFTTTGTKTLTLAGTALTNAFYNVRFSGSGNWSFTEANATTSNLFRITGGNVTLPSNTLSIGDTFTNSAGSFTHNSGTIKFTNTGTKVIDTNSSFYSLRFTGAGSAFSFLDSSVTLLGSLTNSAGTLTLPSGTVSIGGSITNTATLTHNNGTVLFNSTDVGETITLGNSSLYDMTFNASGGGWTISTDATTTRNTTLTSASSFTLASGKRLSVGGTFTNSVGGAPTTWTGSTLVLQAGNYSLNAKTNTGDVYNILQVKASTNIKMWNSSASTYTVNAAGSLYSQDHNAVDGDLYIFGAYTRTSGTEYWSYATDFDGTSLGTTSRRAAVRFASGATANFTGSTVNATGISSATTTVANQGSGSYLIGISAGTTTASYYSFSNLGTSGLSLISGNKVTSLRNGAFNASVGGGTSITLSSTTINANPALQILNVNFSTTSAVVATNVTQVDGTPASYWWFRSSAGNLDGETFDFDTGNPGSVRWDNSSLVFTISGTVYADDGVTPLVGGTCNGVATPVRVKVEGGATYDGTCSAVNGTYSIPGVVSVGDPTITVFLNGASGGQKAVTVTKTPTANITGFDLYANRVITRHQDALYPMTIDDMASYDSTDDTDIMFTAATGTSPILTTLPNTELFVWATTTFTPGGTVTLRSSGSGTVYDGSLHIRNGATFTGAGTTTYSVGGTFTKDAQSIFVPASSTVLMTATTSGKSIAIATGGTGTFNLLRFTGVGGGWNINGNISTASGLDVATGTVTGTGNIAVTSGSFSGNGTLSLGSGTTTISRTNTLGGTRAWTFANLVLGNGVNVGTTTPASTATTTISGKLTIATAHYLKANGAKFNLSGSGNVFLKTGTFLQGTSTIRYSGTAATNVISATYYNLDLAASAGSPTYTATGLGTIVSNAFRIGTGATTTVNFDTSDPALDINGAITIASKGRLIASNVSAFTVAGNWTNNGTFTSSAGTVTFDGSGATSISSGSSSFGNLTVAGTGSFTIASPATTTSACTLTSATAFTLSSGQSLAVGGVFTNNIGGAATTWTGSTLRLFSATNYQINPKTKNDVYETISIAPNTNIRMWNSSATTYTLGSTGSLYSQDHASVDGSLYIYGNYLGNGSTDYWSYATDFDGASLSTTSRQVNVRFASGATALYTTGGLRVLGASSASTTLANQGAGTYGFRIGGTASTSWSYYDVKNAASAGLTFSGTPNVVSLSRGSFTVSTAGGSAITVGGTVINANTARTFTNNIFATTTAIAAFNVTATGTAVSSWRFTNHTGNLAGEAKDVDPDGDPGYIVWDNSAASVTISGHVYSDEGSTVSTMCDSTNPRVHLRIAGLTSYTTSCNGNGAGGGTGAYSITGITFSPGDSLVVYIDGGTAKGAVVSEDLISSVANMDIYENRVIVRHENTDPLSIADMALWDSSADADIPFTAVDAGTDTLTLPANRKLLVWTGKTFAPGGNVTLSGGGAGAAYDGTLEAQTNAVVTFTGTEQHSIGGSFIFGTGATFTAGLSTTTFTTTGSARTIDVNNQSFYNTAFTGSGSWTDTDSTLTLRSARITAGALTLPTGTTTVSGSWNTVGGSFAINGSPMVFTSTSAGNIVKANGSNFKKLIFNGVGGSWSMTDTNATATAAVTIIKGTVSLPSGVFGIGGSFRNTGGTVTHNTSELFMTSTTSATLLASTSSLFAVTFKGTGPFTFSDTSLTLADDFRILQGTVTLPTGTLSVGGSWTTTAGTFVNATGTVLFNASATGKTINTGTSNFYNVQFGSASGGWTFGSSATTTHNFSLTTASLFTVASSTRLSVGGVFVNSVGGAPTTWTGSTLALTSGTEYAINAKTTGGDNYQKLTVGANTDISMWNSKATTTVVSASGSLYSQDHGASDGALRIFGDYHISTTTRYWSYSTDFDGTALGGSPRDVTVSIIANATTTVDGGALSILGTSGHETMVTNQGSGTYSFKVQSGSFNGQYFKYRNLNSAGLSFTGSPTVYSLSYGDFELAVAGGSLIKLASTTLNANASLLIAGNRFATTTAITGYNVKLVGSTTNAWTFSAHTGNLAGESYDFDGGTLCGSIRWSNSSCLLTQQTHYRWRNDDGNVGVPNTEWMNASWTARQRVRLQNPDVASYTNAVVKVHVTYDSDMQTDFDDLRFTDASGTTSLKYFVERYTASADADVWVKVPTLTASQSTTLFMYYKNAAVPSTSSSTQTFLVADDFEDGNKTEYSGDTTLFTVGGTYAYGGSYGLDTTGHTNDRATDGIGRTDVTVSQGQIIRYLQYVSTGSGDEVCTLFGVQAPVTLNHNYGVCLEQVGTNRMSIVKDVVDVETSGTFLASTSVSFTAGWYEVEVDWKSGGQMDVELRKGGTFVASTTANSNTYTSGGIGFTYWFQHGGWDNYTSRTRVTTEPTVYFGAEQTFGGASWKAAVDTSASYATGDIARIRFAIENTGLQITGRTFDLEFAAQGAAPSCEAVSTGSFVHLPNQASCGSSALCMQASANVTDNGTATDLLVGPQINFTSGKTVESPSYTTSAMTLNQNYYTELEYALTPTANATSPNYCLRVTNAGTPVDTYLQVAKLNMRFDPTVTGVSLNGGSDINLLPGSTTTIYTTGTATDLNGASDLDITNTQSVIYRSDLGAGCTPDNNNCYVSTAPRCSFSSCSGNSCTISCSADIYYHADPTDIGSYAGQEWLAAIEVADFAGSIDIGSSPTTTSVEVNTLQALDVTSGAIAYGSLAVSSTTGSFNPTTTVRNMGNIPIDVNIGGTDLSDGATSKIPSWEQRYSTTTFTYTGCLSCSLLSSTTPAHLEVDLNKPTTYLSPVTDIVYWGIAIPFGTASRPHSGNNIFYAVSD